MNPRNMLLGFGAACALATPGPCAEAKDGAALSRYRELLSQYQLGTSPGRELASQWLYGECYSPGTPDTAHAAVYASVAIGETVQAEVAWRESSFGGPLGPILEDSTEAYLFEYFSRWSKLVFRADYAELDGSGSRMRESETGLVWLMGRDPEIPVRICHFHRAQRVLITAGEGVWIYLKESPAVLGKTGRHRIPYKVRNLGSSPTEMPLDILVSVDGPDSSSFKILGDKRGHNPNDIQDPLGAGSKNRGNWFVEIEAAESGKRGSVAFAVRQAGRPAVTLRTEF